MNYRRISLFAAAALLTCTSSHAHFIWLELAPDAPGVVRLRFAEDHLEATSLDMQKKAATMRVSTSEGSRISMAFGEDCMTGGMPYDTSSVVGTQDYGVLDRSEAGRGQFMLKYHARATRDSKAAAIASRLPVDVTAAINGTEMIVTVLLEGKPFAGAELVAVLPQELKPLEAKTDAAGQAHFAVKSGDWVAIRAMVPQEGSGEYDGKSYELIRHYSTLTFFNAAQ